MAIDNKIYINGVALPVAPKQDDGFKIEFEDAYLDATRDNQGRLHKTIARENIRKLYFSFPPLTKEQASQILSMFSPIDVVVSYPNDPKTGVRHTINGYKGNRTAQYYSMAEGMIDFSSLTFNIIEN